MRLRTMHRTRVADQQRRSLDYATGLEASLFLEFPNSCVFGRFSLANETCYRMLSLTLA